MKSSVLKWQVAGFVFTAVLGVLLHFLFDWTGGIVPVALFSAVNESIWEHLKLLLFPMLVFAVIESRWLSKDYPAFWCIKLKGILLGLVLIPVLYYTVNGIFGQTADWVNIAIFFITVAISYLVETRLLLNDIAQCRFPGRAQLLLWVLVLLFIVFTFLPPRIPLFQDPMTGTYGFRQMNR